MDTGPRTLVAVVTLFIALFLTGFGIYTLVHAGLWIVAALCFVVAAGFGFFSYLDFRHFFIDKK